MKNPLSPILQTLNASLRRWYIAKGWYHPVDSDALLVNDELRPLKGVFSWIAKFFHCLAIALVALAFLFGELKLNGFTPFAKMTWWRTLSPLWLGLPLTIFAAFVTWVVLGILARLAYDSSNDDDDDDDDDGRHMPRLLGQQNLARST